MKGILFFVLIIFSTAVYSQTVKVTYDVQIDISGVQTEPFNHQYILVNSNGRSLQKKFLVSSVLGTREDKNNESTRVVKIGNDTTYVYKDFINNSLFSEEKILTKVFKVADELNIFTWKIEEDTLTILNHKCRRATTKFRGREFAAYFAEDIPVTDGPGKFNGLPGLILKVMVVNSTAVFSVEAVEIRLDKSTGEVQNPFSSQKLMSFKDFKKEYNRKYAEMQTFSGEQSGGVVIKKGGLELLFDD
jgi:GLPGLI family protein